ncbi:MAG: hypothetical protein SPL73_05630 [Cyanobacteriota bacterium]|nr:hypothetical protein [Cyanobacteriota bacterium]MDY6364352.1 hypothetical protein [Cyanobacteriota bacterium]
MAEKETKTQLIDRAEEVKEDIERLQKVIDASSETTFEIILEDLKGQMIENVKMESWGTLKTNIKEVDSIKGTQEFISKQTTLLNKKKEELENLNNKINNYQCGLFDDLLDKQIKAEPTGFKKDDVTISLGDVYKLKAKKPEEKETYYLIVKTKKGKYAFVSSIDSTCELELQYPANLLVIKKAEYIGNIHIEDIDHEKAMKAFNIIYQDSRKNADNGEDKG